MRLFIICILNTLLFVLISYSQVASSYNIELEEKLEKISEDTPTSPFLDEINYLIDNPISIDKNSYEKLSNLPGFNSLVANKICSFMKLSNNNSNNISDDISLTPLQSFVLANCTNFSQQNTLPKFKASWSVRNTQEYADIYGFEKNKFQGSPLDLFQRLDLKNENFTASILTNKDPGEKSITDFVSANISYSNKSFKIIAGDYSNEFGMGGILWKSFGMRKGSDAVSPVVQLGRGISPNRSSLASGFFRGIASFYNYCINSNSQLNISAWYSNINRDATLDSTGNYATSIYQSGLFRTETEIKKRNAINEISYGTDINYKSNNFIIGGNLLKLNYNKEIITQSNAYLQGRSGFLSSLYLLYLIDKWSIGTELSRDATGNLAFKAGSQLVDAKYDIAFLIRSLSSKFCSPYGYSFGESSTPSNEYGIYSGFGYKNIKNITLSFYMDLYSTWDHTTEIPAIVKGIDLFSEMKWKANDNNQLTIRLQYENKTDKINIDEQHIYQKGKIFFRVEFKHNINSDFYIRIRTDAVHINFESYTKEEYGLGGFAEFVWQNLKGMLFGGRISVYSTDSWNTVIYQYESSIPGLMSSVPLYNQGYRISLFAKIRVIDNLKLNCQYTYSIKNNTNTLSSSLNTIEGNTDRKLILQLETNF